MGTWHSYLQIHWMLLLVTKSLVHLEMVIERITTRVSLTEAYVHSKLGDYRDIRLEYGTRSGVDH